MHPHSLHLVLLVLDAGQLALARHQASWCEVAILMPDFSRCQADETCERAANESLTLISDV
jgi:hypothetical protein